QRVRRQGGEGTGIYAGRERAQLVENIWFGLGIDWRERLVLCGIVHFECGFLQLGVGIRPHGETA
ncbi:MAG: hypothetical protein HY700_06505, partial [Gemmatimonadetes bacterium]|nr:hypothetical protein [Gemmatimonadota bacterium]